MKRKLIIVASTIAILAIGMLIQSAMESSKQLPPKVKKENIAKVYVATVTNGTVPIHIEATGKLVAKRRSEIFAEVQGVMLPTKKEFKPGIAFQKGEVLLEMDAAVFRANVIAQRSNLLNLITGALADIRMDFPGSFPAWEKYAQNLNPKKTLAPLPEPTNEQERLFISGRSILSTYFNVKNAELQLAKYQLSAPFNGVLIEATVTPGSLVRPGQRLGAFIAPNHFEMETEIPAQWGNRLKIGQTVQLIDANDRNTKVDGTIARINQSVNAATQSVRIFIDVKSKQLKEGAYLQATIAADSIPNAFEIPRSLLLPDDKVYVVKNNTLETRAVSPLFFKEKTVVLGGLAEGLLTLAKPLPNAYPGMKTEILPTEVGQQN